MRKFYETKPVLFAVLWIAIYVVLVAPLRGSYGDGSLQMLLGLVAISAVLLAVIRLMLPEVLLPATTALGTIHPFGREMGLLAGANVIMPNLSPGNVRSKYLLYDGKICTGDEAAECRRCMDIRVEKTGYHVTGLRGDHKRFVR